MIKKQLREKHLIKYAILRFLKMLNNIKYYYKYIKQNKSAHFFQLKITVFYFTKH